MNTSHAQIFTVFSCHRSAPCCSKYIRNTIYLTSFSWCKTFPSTQLKISFPGIVLKDMQHTLSIKYSYLENFETYRNADLLHLFGKKKYFLFLLIFAHLHDIEKFLT